MPFAKLESRYTIPANCQATHAQVGGGTASYTFSLAEGTYYLVDLCAYVQAQLNAQAGGSTYTVTIDDDADTSTGKITITKTSAGTFTLTWTLSTGLRDALGFTGTLTPTAAAFTSTNASPHIWLPTCGRTDAALGDGDDGWPVKTAAVNVATSGATYSWVGAATRYENVMAFDSIKGYRAITSQEAVVNESLQTFWTYGPGLGKPFRYYKSRATDGTYNAFCAAQQGVETFRPERVVANHYGPNALFRWSCPVYKYTGS